MKLNKSKMILKINLYIFNKSLKIKKEKQLFFKIKYN